MVQVLVTWARMRKLATLIKFMKRLLLFVFIKSVALIAEATVLFAVPDLDEYEKKYIALTTLAEFMNWIST